MSALACLLLAAAGKLAFALLAHPFRPARRVLCQPAPARAGRHRAEG